MAEPRFEIGQDVHVAQYHCSVCKKLEFELQHPVRVMAIEPYADGFEYRIEDARGCITGRRRSVYAAAHRGIAAVRATSAGRWFENSRESVV